MTEQHETSESKLRFVGGPPEDGSAAKEYSYSVVTTHWMCERCEPQESRGEMLFTGTVLTTDPGQYVHKCSKCGWSANGDKIYPSTTHPRQPCPTPKH